MRTVFRLRRGGCRPEPEEINDGIDESFDEEEVPRQRLRVRRSVMQIFTFRELLTDLHRAQDWLRAMGFCSRNDRFRQIITVVEDAVHGFESARATGRPTRIGAADQYYFPLIEGLELRDVYFAFRDADRQTLRSKLRRAIRGPLQPHKETPETSDARNTMFELSLAAEWKLRGASVQIGDPDISLNVRGICYRVECKRPWRQHSIRPNVKGAGEQLDASLLPNPSTFGAIFVSVSRVLDNGRSLFVVPGGVNRGTNLLLDKVEELFVGERSRWRASWFPARTVMIAFHASVAAVFGERLYRASSTVGGPVTNKSPSFHVLKDEMLHMYGADARSSADNP